jgi:hypothetical protein
MTFCIVFFIFSTFTHCPLSLSVWHEKKVSMSKVEKKELVTVEIPVSLYIPEVRIGLLRLKRTKLSAHALEKLSSRLRHFPVEQ